MLNVKLIFRQVLGLVGSGPFFRHDAHDVQLPRPAKEVGNTVQ